MKGSKLLEILSTFSEDEIKSFEKFIDSPFFERQRDVSGIYSQIKKYHPNFKDEDLDWEKVFSKLYPKESYNEKKLKNLTSELTKLAEQFLFYRSIRTDQIDDKLTLASEYKKRDLDSLFLSIMKTVEEKLNDPSFDSYEGFNQSERFYFLKDEYYFWKNDFDESIKNRIEATEYFTLTFLIKYLQRLRDKNMLTLRYNKPFENSLLDTLTENIDFEKIIDSLKKSNYRFVWLLEIYYYIYLCEKDISDSENFYKLKALFLNNIDFFSKESKDQIFSSMVGYCERAASSGNGEMYREEFELINKMFEYEVFTGEKNKFINPVIFRNIMLLALKLKEYDWLEDFGKGYIEKLKPNFRENLDHLLKANLNFARKNFDEALYNLSDIKYDHFMYKFDVKNLMLKIYYELGLYSQAYSMIDAFKHFLDDNKEHSEIHNQNYRNFLNIYTKLIKVKESGKFSELPQLFQITNSTKSLASRIWILEKLNEMNTDSLKSSEFRRT